jgi:hypothetical protein
MAKRRNTSTLNGTFTGDRRFTSSIISAYARTERILRETATANGSTVLPRQYFGLIAMPLFELVASVVRSKAPKDDFSREKRRAEEREGAAPGKCVLRLARQKVIVFIALSMAGSPDFSLSVFTNGT